MARLDGKSPGLSDAMSGNLFPDALPRRADAVRFDTSPESKDTRVRLAAWEHVGVL